MVAKRKDEDGAAASQGAQRDGAMEPAPARPVELADYNWPAHSVLVVDDEEGMRNFLERTLARRCGMVQSAADAEHAAALMARLHFDLLVLDIALPGKSGIEWLHELREHGYAGDVILITAFADMETAIDALRGGASDFILKPFRVDQILNSIKRCFERARLTRENFVLRRELAGLAVIRSAWSGIRPRSSNCARWCAASGRCRARCCCRASPVPARRSWRVRCIRPARARSAPSCRSTARRSRPS